MPSAWQAWWQNLHTGAVASTPDPGTGESNSAYAGPEPDYSLYPTRVYVDGMSGSDSNGGTSLSDAYKTINRGFKRVQELYDAGTTEGVCLWIKGSWDNPYYEYNDRHYSILDHGDRFGHHFTMPLSDNNDWRFADGSPGLIVETLPDDWNGGTPAIIDGEGIDWTVRESDCTANPQYPTLINPRGRGVWWRRMTLRNSAGSGMGNNQNKIRQADTRYQQIHVHHCYGEGIIEVYAEKAPGILGSYVAPNAHVVDILVHHNESYYDDGGNSSGLKFSRAEGDLSGDASKYHIEYCSFFKNGDDGLDMRHSPGAHVHHCVSAYNGWGYGRSTEPWSSTFWDGDWKAKILDFTKPNRSSVGGSCAGTSRGIQGHGIKMGGSGSYNDEKYHHILCFRNAQNGLHGDLYTDGEHNAWNNTCVDNGSDSQKGADRGIDNTNVGAFLNNLASRNGDASAYNPYINQNGSWTNGHIRFQLGDSGCADRQYNSWANGAGAGCDATLSVNNFGWAIDDTWFEYYDTTIGAARDPRFLRPKAGGTILASTGYTSATFTRADGYVADLPDINGILGAYESSDTTVGRLGARGVLVRPGIWTLSWNEFIDLPPKDWTAQSDGTAPSVPANLTATAGDSQVALDWDDSTNTGNAESFSHYNVYRSTVSPVTKNDTLVATPSTSGYTDTGRTNGSTYYYAVSSEDTLGDESGLSAEVSATPQATTTTTVTDATSASADDSTLLSSTFTSTSAHVFTGEFDSTNYNYRSFMRFQLNVPQGATITAASLTLMASSLSGAIPTTQVRAELSDNALQIDTQTEFEAAEGASRGNLTTANVSWTPAAWTLDTAYESADIASVIQEIVNRAGWVSGNFINIWWGYASTTWTGTQQRITAYSFDNAANAPSISVTYEGEAAPVTGSQYEEDWSSHTTGAAPTGWAKRWTTSGDAWEIVDDISSNGGKSVKHTISGSSDRRILTYDEIDGDPNSADIDIMAMVRTDTDNNTNSDFRVQQRLYARAGEPTAGDFQCYYLALHAGDEIVLEKYSGGTVPTLGSAAFTWAANDRICMRLQCSGTTIRGKAWVPADPANPTADEPAGWSISATDSEFTDGWAGIGTWGSEGIRHYEWVTFGTGDQLAPAPA